MKNMRVNKGLVLCVVWLVASVSVYSVAGSQPEQKDGFKKNVLNPVNPSTNEVLGQLSHPLKTQLGLYAIISSSGAGLAFHGFFKIPHIRNQKGFFIATIILYPGLTAFTTVLQYTTNVTNGTAWKIVDSRLGPHIVVFIGLGFSMFKRSIIGGKGKMFGVTLFKPHIYP